MKSEKISRRDFLKLSGLGLAGLITPPIRLLTEFPKLPREKQPNFERINHIRKLDAQNKKLTKKIEPIDVGSELVKVAAEIKIAQTLRIPNAVTAAVISTEVLSGCALSNEPVLENKVIPDSDWVNMDGKSKLIELGKGNAPESWNKLADQPIPLAQAIAVESESLVYDFLCQPIGCNRTDSNPMVFTYTKEELINELRNHNYSDNEIQDIINHASALETTSLLNNEKTPIIRFDDELEVFYPQGEPIKPILPAQIALFARATIEDILHEITHITGSPKFTFDLDKAEQLAELFQNVPYVVDEKPFEVVSIDSQLGPRIFITVKDPSTGTFYTSTEFIQLEEARRAYIDYRILKDNLGENIAYTYNRYNYLEIAHLYENLLNKIGANNFDEWFEAHSTLPIDELCAWYQVKTFQAGFNNFQKPSDGFILLSVMNNLTDNIMNIEWDNNISIELNVKKIVNERKKFDKVIESILENPY